MWSSAARAAERPARAPKKPFARATHQVINKDYFLEGYRYYQYENFGSISI